METSDFPVQFKVDMVRWNKTGSHVAIVSDINDSIIVWCAESGEIVREFERIVKVRQLEWKDDARDHTP